jgi:hypothetical protein
LTPPSRPLDRRAADLGICMMRCMVCGGEMRVVGIVPDETISVGGFERHTLRCADCRDTEQRLVFNRPAKFTPVHDAPPLSTVDEAAAVKEGEEALRQAMESMRGPEGAEARKTWQRTVADLRGRPAGEK